MIEQLAQREAVDVVHDDVVLPAGRGDLRVDRADHVRVLDLRGEPRFVAEHLDDLRLLREVLVHDLDREQSFEAAGTLKPAQVDGPHRTAADLGQQLVAAEHAPRRLCPLDLGFSSH